MKKYINLLFASAFIVLLSLILSSCTMQNSNTSLKSIPFGPETKRNYKEAITILEEDYIGYNDAVKVEKMLYRFSDEYKRNAGEEEVLNKEDFKDARYLYYYAKAFSSFTDPKSNNRSSCEYSLPNINKIPTDYNGKFSDKITELRKKILAKNETVQKNIEEEMQKYKAAQKERESKIYLGDPGFKVLQILGEPIRKNKTTTQNGIREQWVYGNGTYIYLENGSVTSWQTSE